MMTGNVTALILWVIAVTLLGTFTAAFVLLVEHIDPRPARRCAWCDRWASPLDRFRFTRLHRPITHTCCRSCSESIHAQIDALTKTPAPDGRPVGGSETLLGNDLPSHRTSISEDEAA